MTTNVVMESIDREIDGLIIKQRTKDEFFNLTNVLFLCDKWRNEQGLNRFLFDQYLLSDNVKAFLAELEREIGVKPYIKATKSSAGWIHPFFAIKILLHCNPVFEVKVYKWLWDYLIKNRISSGDSYKRMCGALFQYSSNKRLNDKAIILLANKIKATIGCDDWNKATQEQLEKRDYLQNIIADFTSTLKDSKRGVEYGFQAYFMRYAEADKLT